MPVLSAWLIAPPSSRRIGQRRSRQRRLTGEGAGFDPHRALDGGNDGLAPYPAICRAAMQLLRPGAALVLEHGHDQEGALRGIAESVGLVFAGSETDLGGVLRAQAFTRPD